MDDLIERLKAIDEVTLLELLEINSDSLVDAFMDKIEEKLPQIQSYLDD